MFQQIIDRRLAGKNKSIGNRERFLRRYKDKVREAVQRQAQREQADDPQDAAACGLGRRRAATEFHACTLDTT